MEEILHLVEFVVPPACARECQDIAIRGPDHATPSEADVSRLISPPRAGTTLMFANDLSSGPSDLSIVIKAMDSPVR
jgi:hypothetical protein